MLDLSKYKDIVNGLNPYREVGKVTQIIGLIIELTGPSSALETFVIFIQNGSEPYGQKLLDLRQIMYFLCLLVIWKD